MRRFLPLIFLLLLFLPTAPVALAATPNGTVPAAVFDYDTNAPGAVQALPRVSLRLDGDALEGGGAPGVIVDGRTLAPLRLLCEALGAQVDWLPHAPTQVRVTGGGYVIDLTLGSPTATVNGSAVTLPGGVPAGVITYQGRDYTMVPLRFFSETLGCKVGWDQGGYTASVYSPGYIDPLLEPLDSPVEPGDCLIALDAGHGGAATGAFYENVAEKDLNLSIAGKLRDILGALGYNTLMIRDGDEDVDLSVRAATANAAGADLFVSIHCNAAENRPDFQGLYVYYYPESPAGQALARSIQAPACAFTGAVDRDIDSANFVVLRETTMPAALVEVGFMTCHEELTRLLDDAYQTRAAQGIAQGVIRYWNGVKGAG